MAGADKDTPKVDRKAIDEWITGGSKSPDDFDTGTVSRRVSPEESRSPDDFPETERRSADADADADGEAGPQTASGNANGGRATQDASADRERTAGAGTSGTEPDKRRWSDRRIVEHNDRELRRTLGEQHGEPMTDDQREHLRVLSAEAGEDFPVDLRSNEAERRIDELRRRMGHKP